MDLAVGSSIIKSPVFIKRICWEELSITIILLLLLSSPAFSASFDCKKAASWLEKTVCSNPELSRLDEEMAKAYSDAMTSLSPEGQKETKKYQKKWQKELSSHSEAKYTLGFGDEAGEAENAVKTAYKKRIKQLQESLIKFNDRIFRNVYINYSEPKEECSGIFTKKYFTYPQIENPQNENEQFWNHLISKQANDFYKAYQSYGVCESIYYSYNISFSNKHIISIHGERIVNMVGSPESVADESFSWLLKEKRKLKASDLFDSKLAWSKKLVTLVAQKIKEKEITNKTEYKMKFSKLSDRVKSPSQWVILKYGFGIQFNEDDFNDVIRPFPFVITLDWKTLDPYLSKNGRSLIYE
jgi:uncharacterized protein YecT (DUF1311 family)